MGVAAKRRIVVAVLACLLLWVPIHRLLVHRFDLNPWKFGGFAMYAAPAPKIGIGFYTEKDGALTPLHLASHSEDQPLFLEFFATRKHMGMLARPDVLAARVFERAPPREALAIIITSHHLNPVSARIEATQHGYRYQREHPIVPSP
jgi:hypothetical protein